MTSAAYVRVVSLLLCPLALGGGGANVGQSVAAPGSERVMRGNFTLNPSPQLSAPHEMVLHRFQNGSDGARPEAGLVADAMGALYGTTADGGVTGNGMAFKLTPSGSGYVETVLHGFGVGNDGANPYAGLIVDNVGALYGTTASGGAHGYGTVFKLTPIGSRYAESVLYDFRGGKDGAQPVAGLLGGAGGPLYGTTESGGAKGYGTVFKLAPSGSGYSESVLYTFKGGKDGERPMSTLIVDKNGALYGTTSSGGGASINGTVFKLAPSGTTYTESVLHAFGRGKDGAYPDAGLIADSTGALYGTTASGGDFNRGTAFRLAPSQSGYTETVLHSFRGRADGAQPAAGLVAGSTGVLYGTTYQGGGSNNGTVFDLTPSGSGYHERTLHVFRGRSDGSQPTAGLIIDASGALFGTTDVGGPTTKGTVFKLSPSQSGFAESVLYSFASQNDGGVPYAGLYVDGSGALYGTTIEGGVANNGTVFKLTQSGEGYAETVLYRFRGGRDGAFPLASLIADRSGALYGTTTQGGTSNDGTVFKLSPSPEGYSERVVYRFQGGSDGARPSAALIAGKAGALYGTTINGGVSNSGTVFRLSPSGRDYTETVLYAFRGGNDGAGPAASLITDSTGALYGTTSQGGGSSHCLPVGCGTVFKLTPAGGGYAERVLYAFQGGSDGARTSAQLIADKTGALYGTTQGGGVGGQFCPGIHCGTVFKLTPSGSGYSETILYRFQGGEDGDQPYAGLIADAKGALYGTTYHGGGSSKGTVFKLSPSGSSYTESLLYRFQGGTGGAQPYAGLTVGASRTLYGTTAYGGSAGNRSFGNGTVFVLTL